MLTNEAGATVASGSSAGSIALTGLTTGCYNLKVTDANGCASVKQVCIGEDAPTYTFDPTTLDPTCKQNNGTIQLNPAGLVGPTTYTWTGPFGTFPSDDTADSLYAGVYTVVVNDNGCDTTLTFILNNEDSPVIVASITTTPSCNGSTDGGFTFTATAGGNPLAGYVVTGVQSGVFTSSPSTVNITGLGAGTYTIKVYDNQGCETFETITITQPDQLLVDIKPDAETKCKAFDGTACITINGGTGPYTVALTLGTGIVPTSFVAGVETCIQGLTKGDYAVEVTDSKGCKTTQAFTIGGPDSCIDCKGFGLVSVVDIDTKCGENNGEICATVTGGTAPFTYTITNHFTGAIIGTTTINDTFYCITNLPVGQYNVHVTDATNVCADSSQNEIENIGSPNLSSNNITTNPNCGQSNGLVGFIVSGGVAPYTYDLYDENGVAINVGAAVPITLNLTVGGLSAGCYTIVLHDANGCVDIEKVCLVDGPISYTVSTAITQPTCGNADGEIELTVSEPSATFAWSGPNGSFTAGTTASNLAAGIYTVKVSVNGCDTTLTISLNNIDGPSVIATTTPVGCNGTESGSITITGTNGSNPIIGYVIEGVSAGSLTAGTPLTTSALAAGTYNIKVVDATGCVGYTTATITEPSDLLVDIAPIEETGCDVFDGRACITINGGTAPYTVSFITGSGIIPGNFQESVEECIIGLGAGSYEVRVTDANGCITQKTFTINSIDTTCVDCKNFAIESVTVLDATCGRNDGNLCVNVDGGTAPFTYTVILTTNNSIVGTSTTTATQYCINDLGVGLYKVYVTDSFGVCIDSSLNEIENIGEPTLTANGNTINPGCGLSNGSIGFLITGGLSPYRYDLFDENGVAININAQVPLTGNLTIGGLYASCYTLTVRDANGCTDIRQVCLKDGPVSYTVTPTLTAPTCGNSNGQISLAVSAAGATFTWSGPNGVFVDDATASNLVAGNYTVTVSVNGCDTTLSISLNNSNGPVVSASSMNATCNNSNNGSLTITATAGSVPLVGYIVDGVQTGNITSGSPVVVSNLAPGTYTIQVVDENSCIGYASVTITSPLDLRVDVAPFRSDCQSPTGSACVTVNGGTTNYTIILTQGSGTIPVSFSEGISSCITNLAVGLYTIQVTDANGCITSKDFEIKSNAPCTPSDTVRFILSTFDSIIICDTALENNVVLPASSQLCSGGTTGSSMFGSWTVLPNGCIKYVSNGIVGNEVEVICVVTIDSLGNIDTTRFIPTIIPRPDTIIRTVQQYDSVTVCPTHEPGFGLGATSTVLCDGSNSASSANGSWSIVNGCLKFTADNEPGYPVETICVKTYDSLLMMWDTTIIIINVPTTKDTIRFTLPVDSTITICDTAFENSVDNPFTTQLCGQSSPLPDSSIYGTWNAINYGCLVYNSKLLTGVGVDTICVITVDSNGESDTTIFIATITPRANIGNYVWLDTDKDGIQDSTEMGIQSVTVTLKDSAGNVIGTTTTDANGFYQFNNVPLGNYQITFDATTAVGGTSLVGSPNNQGGDDAVDSDADPISHTTAVFFFNPALGNNYTFDAGFYVSTAKDTIRDTLPTNSTTIVCDPLFENNVNGGTTATICGAGTSGSSAYGNYTVDANGCLTYNSGGTAGNSIDTVCVVTTDSLGRIDTTIFILTITPRASIGNYVWNDTNHDGIQDPTESGIANVTVYLLNSAGDTIATTTTNGSGFYVFNNVPEGDYQIAFNTSTATGSWTSSPNNVGGDDTKDSDQDPITLVTPVFSFNPANGNDFTHDAGFYTPIKDTIRFTLPTDSTRTECDLVLENGTNGGTTTRLCDGGTAGSNAYGTWVVNEVGCLTFNSNNLSGNDVATVCVVTTDSLGRTDTTIFIVTVTPRGSIGNYVWNDTNGDGVQDATESGVEDVTVYLLNAAGDTVATTTTDANGQYVFTNVPEGNYSIAFDPSTTGTGYVFTGQDQGGDDTKDSDPNATGTTAVFYFNPAVTPFDSTHDAGLVIPTVLDTIRFTLPTDSTTTVCDVVLENGVGTNTVTTLCDGTSLSGSSVYGSWTVSESGCLTYNSNNLPGNNVDTICVKTVDTLTGKVDSTIFIISITPRGSIGNYVWNDTNGDGVQDATESGVEDVTVYLLNAAGDTVATTTTDANGQYVFTNVPEGNYSIAFDPSTTGTGYVFTGQDLGGDDTKDSDPNATGTTAVFYFNPAVTPFDSTHDAGLVIPTVLDTIRFTLPTDSTTTVCDVVLENGVGTNTVTTLCDGTSLSGSSVYGSWTVSESGCLTYNSNNLPGNNVDTICVKTVDTVTGKVDSTIFIISITPVTASIGDYVWNDTDGDGVQDSSETGLQNVTVYLIDATTGDTLATALTDATGHYIFNNVPAGSYQVAFDVSTTITPGIWIPTTGNAGGDDTKDSDINLGGITPVFTFNPNNGNNLTLDAGYVNTQAVKDTIRFTLPTDSTRTECDLVLENGTNGGTTTRLCEGGTSGSNAYGTWVVNEVGCLTFNSNNLSGNDIATVCVVTTDSLGRTDTTIFIVTVTPRGSIGNYVWNDTNGDGVQDATESGVEDVTVYLLNAAGDTVATTTTDANGQYVFTNVPEGNYSIAFDPSTTGTGYVFTGRDLGGDDTKDSDPNATGTTAVFYFNPAVTPFDSTHDAGLVIPTVLDTIRFTLPTDSTTTVCDPVLENGVNGTTTAESCDMTTSGSSTYGSWTIDNNGCITYTSNNLPGANVDTVCVVTTDADGNKDTTIFIISITPRGSIGNYVWNDTDKDGVQDATESGVADVTVYLLNAAGDTVATTTTDANGQYVFTNVPEGNYSIAFDPSTTGTGYVFTGQDQGGDDTKDSDPNATGTTAVFYFNPAVTPFDSTHDAGLVIPTVHDTIYFSLPTLSDTMVCDLILENGVNGVLTSQLCNPLDLSSIYGYWAAGPDGCLTYHSNNISGNHLDTICVVTIDANGRKDTTIFIVSITPVTATIGNYVWNDVDGDGIQDTTESGIENVTVYLIDATTGDTIATTLSDANGYYEFTNVPEGDYQVAFDPSTSGNTYTGSPQNQGGNDSTDSDINPITFVTPVFHFDPHNGDDLTIDAGLVCIIDTLRTIDTTICAGSTVVVNGITYDATGTYYVPTTNGQCPAVDELNLIVSPSTSSAVSATICSGDTTTLGTQVLTTSGVYTETFTGSNGCDSVVTLNLTALPANVTDVNATICAGDSIIVGGVKYGTAGNYTATLAAANGCDSTVNISLVVLGNNDTSRIAESICEGGSVTVGGQTFTTAGVHYVTVTNGQCEGVVELTLTVNQPTTSTITTAVCAGTIVNVGGNSYTQSGTFTIITTNSVGCDSTITLNLTVNEPSATVIDSVICAGSTVTVGGNTYNTSGTHVVTLTNAAGCDSVVTLNLSVLTPDDTARLTLSFCTGGSVAFNGTTYTTAGEYTIAQSTPCSGVTVLTVVENTPSATTIDRTICLGQSVVVGGQTFTTAGTHTVTLANSNGCDSVITLNLVVNTPSKTVIDSTVCAGESVTLMNQTFDATGTYQIISNNAPCTDTLVLNLYVYNCTIDTIRDTNTVTTVNTICPVIDPVLDNVVVTVVNCGHTNTSGNTYTVDPLTNCISIVRSTLVGYNLDTICIIITDTIKDVTDTAVAIISNTPKVDTLRDTNVVGSTVTVCVEIEPGMTAGPVEVVNCGHVNNSGNVYTSGPVDGCITITRSETVGYNLDTLCLVMTDPITGITDTTVGIFSNLPVRDTIRDTNTVTTLDTLCMNVNPGMNADTVIITNCNGGPLTTVNTYNTLANGCIEIVRNTTVGYNVDTLCVIVRDTTKGIDDTTTVIISNTPKVDTLRDTNVVGSTVTVCVEIEPGMTAGPVEVVNCGHVNNSGNVYTSGPVDGCITITRSETVGYNLDTLCLVMTDPITGITDTTVGIFSNLPVRDTIRDTNTVTTLDTLCMNVNPGMNADTVIITNCNGGPLTTVNTYNTLANGCIEIVRSTTVGYNVDTLCVIVRDTTKGIDDTTTVIISNTPKVDTIRDTNVVNTTDTLCITLEPGMTGGDIEVNFCGHVNNSGNIYTAIPNSNCVEIVRGNTVGFSLDTICIIITDPITGIKDTTIGIISNIPNPCPDVIRDTVLSCNANDSAGLCIALNLANIRKYNIFIDGTRSAQQFSSRTGCGEAIVDAGYNFQVVNYVDNVPHLLEEWGIDAGNTLSPFINFNTLSDLADYMNSVEPTGGWYVDGLNIKASNPDIAFRTGSGLQFFSEDPEAATYTVRYNDRTTYTGSLLKLSKGCHNVVMVDTTTGCIDSAQICVIGCVTNDTIRDSIPVRDSALVCVPVEPGLTGHTIEILDNCGGVHSGNIYTTASGTCINVQTSDTVGANIDTICVVVCDTVYGICDTTKIIITNTPKVDTLRDTNQVETTNIVCVPNEPGFTPVSTEIVNCGHNNNSGNIYTVDSIGCINIVRSTNVGYNLDTLCIVKCNEDGLCDTTIAIFSNTPGCPDLISDTTIECTSRNGAGLCVSLSLANIRQYNIFIDGTRSAQQFSSQSGCGQTIVDAGFNFEVIDYVDDVPHLLESWGIDAATTLSPNINFNTLDDLAMYMNSIVPEALWYVDGLNIKATNPDAAYREGSGLQFFSEDPEAASYTVRYNDKTTYTGSIINVPRGCHVVTLVDTVTGCRDSATICVIGSCTPTDTIRDTIPVRDTLIICNLVTPADSNVVVTSCDGNTQGSTLLGNWSIDSTNCLVYHSESTVGNDTLCIVKCDIVKGICDTVPVIITVTPRTDIIRDTNYINTNTSVCMPVEPGFGTVTSAAIVNCGYNNNSGNTYALLSVNPPCILTIRSSTVGYNLDTLCVVACNSLGSCDTTRVIISNITRDVRDTIRDTTPVTTILTVCDFVPADTANVVVTNCDGMTVGQANFGLWSIDANKCLVYSAGPIKGTDTLCIKVCNTETQICNETTVIVTVTGLPPVAIRNDTITDPNTPVVISVLNNDIKTDEDSLSLCPDAIVMTPSNGSVIVNQDGTITYTPNQGYTGIDSFIYQICDPEGIDTAIVYITITNCQLPTVITPNGDGINDVFVVSCPSSSPISFCVFNRWGIEVYRNENYGQNSNFFDGNYQGSPLPDGTYYYVIKYTNDKNEAINKAHYLTIHR
jgi:gliding motility-associated-like protein